MISMKDFIGQELENGLSIDEVLIYRNYNEIRQNHCHLHLNESYARYKGQYQLAEFLTLKFSRNNFKEGSISFSKKELEDKKFENIFFDKITIKYGKFNNSAAYVGDIDKENFVIKHVNIIIDLDEKMTYESFFSSLSHELKHAWQDYKKLYNKEFTLNNLSSSDKVYQECTKYLGQIDAKGVASNIIYRCKNFEYDAYASEFSSEFKHLLNKEKPKNIDECPNIAKQVNSYLEVLYINLIIEYFDIGKKIDNFKIWFNRNDLLEEAKKLLNKDELTWEYFYNNYCRKLRKLFSKFCNIIGNNYFEYSEQQNKENKKNMTNESFNGVPSAPRSFIFDLVRYNPIDTE